MPTDPTPDNLKKAYLEADEKCRAIADPVEAFREATALRDRMDQFVGEAAKLRAEMVHRTQCEGSLSIGQAGVALGMSKARAEQLINTAKQAIAQRESDRKSATDSECVSHALKPAIDARE